MVIDTSCIHWQAASLLTHLRDIIWYCMHCQLCHTLPWGKYLSVQVHGHKTMLSNNRTSWKTAEINLSGTSVNASKVHSPIWMDARIETIQSNLVQWPGTYVPNSSAWYVNNILQIHLRHSYLCQIHVSLSNTTHLDMHAQGSNRDYSTLTSSDHSLQILLTTAWREVWHSAISFIFPPAFYAVKLNMAGSKAKHQGIFFYWSDRFIIQGLQKKSQCQMQLWRSSYLNERRLIIKKH